MHRDLKPENVLVDATADTMTLRLTDFGVSRLFDTTLTKVTSMIGTPGYLAPELAAGERPTAAADVYALGVVLHEMLCGRPPFEATNVLALLRAHADDPVKRPVGMSDQLWHLLDSMLAKSPAERPTADQVVAAAELLASSLDEGPFAGVVPPPTASDATVVRAIAPSVDSDVTIVRPSSFAPPAAAATGIITVDDIPKVGDVPKVGVGAVASVVPRDADTAASAPATVQPPLVVVPVSSPSGRRKGLLVAAVVALAAVTIGAVAVLRPDESASIATPATEDTYTLPPVVYPGNVVVSEQWELQGDGDRLLSTVAVSNSGDGVSSGDHFIVIPKSAAADVSDVTFSPEPDEIVERDPVVRYSLEGLAPGEARTITWSVELSGGDPVDGRLDRLATDQIAAERQFGATYDGAPAPVSLMELTVDPATVTLAVGESTALLLSTLMSDGSAAPPDALASVSWSAADSSIASVGDDGTVTALAAGSTTVTAQAGELQATATLEVIVAAATSGASSMTSTSSLDVAETTVASATNTTAKPPGAATSTTKPSVTATTKPPAPTTTKPPAPTTTKPPAPTTTKPPVTTTTVKPAPTTTLAPPPPGPSIGTAKGGVATGGGAPPNANWVMVVGSGFAPNSSLRVVCEGAAGSFALGTTDGAGNFPYRQSLCWHTPGFPQRITVIDATGRQATTVSSW